MRGGRRHCVGCHGLSCVVMGGHPETRHLYIPISHHRFQAVRNERAPWLNGQMT